MVVFGPPQSANDVGHRRPPSSPANFSAHLIDDGDEIRERLVAQRRIGRLRGVARAASRVIDSRTDIVILLADPTRTAVHRLQMAMQEMNANS
jgi:hypothetical protein